MTDTTTPELTEEAIEELERLQGLATKGPFRCTPKDCFYHMSSLFIDREGDGSGVGLVTSDINQDNATLYATDEDMDLIAALLNTAPALLAEVRRLRVENERIRGYHVETLKDCVCARHIAEGHEPTWDGVVVPREEYSISMIAAQSLRDERDTLRADLESANTYLFHLQAEQQKQAEQAFEKGVETDAEIARLRTENGQLRAALLELVVLEDDVKETDPDDYERRKPLAWAEARRLVGRKTAGQAEEEGRYAKR